MILFISRVIKLLFLFMVLATELRLFRKRLTIQKLISLGIVTVFFAVIANLISGFLPPLTEQVTVTALGEKREESRETEVCLNGYSIDGKTFNSLDSLDIVEGHWFWSGNCYCWRPETDNRQPEGITRTIVINIPVGQDRMLNFNGNEDCGLVEIFVQRKGISKVLDTYAAESDSIISESIGMSETSVLIWNKIRYMALYAAVFLGLSFFTVAVTVKSLSEPEHARIWLKQNLSRFIYGGIALVTFVLMICYADKVSLWFDELLQVAFTNGTLKEALLHCLNMGESSPPLQLMVSTVWYHMVPYGERWLFMMNIMLCAIAIYLIGMAGERINGMPCGIFAVIFTAFSNTVWMNIAYEYRAYPFFFFFSSLVLYCYVSCNQADSGRKQSIFFSCAMAGLAMSHYFGMLACAGLFIADGCLFFNKRVTFKRIIPYLFPGALSTVWLGAVLLTPKSFGGTFWTPVPSLLDAGYIFKFISGSGITFYILLLSYLVWFAILFRHSGFWKKFYFSMFSLIILCTILLLMFYGNFINPSFTLWSERYFTFLIPCASLLAGLTVYEICNVISKYLRSRTYMWVIACIFLGGVLFLNCLMFVSNATSSQPYREAADWIYTQSDYIFNKDSIVVSINSETVIEGWNDYYITRQGRRDEINIVGQYELTEDAILSYNKIYLVSIHNEIEPWFQECLDEYYKLETDNTNIKVKVYVRK